LCKKKRWTDDYKLIDVNWNGNPQKSLATLSCNDVWHANKDVPVLNETCCSKLNLNHSGSSSLIRPVPLARVVVAAAALAEAAPVEDPIPPARVVVAAAALAETAPVEDHVPASPLVVAAAAVAEAAPVEDHVPAAPVVVAAVALAEAAPVENPVPVDNQAMEELVADFTNEPLRVHGGPIRHARGQVRVRGTLGARRTRRRSTGANMDAIRRSDRHRNART